MMDCHRVSPQPLLLLLLLPLLLLLLLLLQLGGATKNVIAIAAGMCEGLGLGTNAMAALVTRGCQEMQRLALSMGANPITLTGR